MTSSFTMAGSSPPLPGIPGSIPSSPASSTASWDFSIQQLSHSLSQICGNSPNSSCGDLPGLKDGQNGGGSNGHLHRSFSDAPTSPRIMTDTPSKPVYMGNTGRMCKKIRIRHEESRKRLHEQLAFICKGKSGLDNSLIQEPLQRPVIRRGSMSNALRINLDIGEVQPEQLSVRVGSQSVDICKVVGNETDVIQSEHITSQFDVESVSCCLDVSSLSIREYPTKCLKMQCPTSDRNYFLPILQQDDVTGTWRLMLHVPGCYDTCFKPLQVKTIDEKLHVLWQQNQNMEQGKVIVDLPPNAVTRSVSGVITEDNQLIVVGLLGARNRCCTL